MEVKRKRHKANFDRTKKVWNFIKKLIKILIFFLLEIDQGQVNGHSRRL